MNRGLVVVESGEASKLDLLDAVLAKTGFDQVLAAAQARAGKTKEEFLILIKPNLAMFFKDGVTVTDPELVEHLVDHLHDLGYVKVVLGEAQNTFFKWLENREIPTLARAVGYRFRTPKGRGYEVVDLAEDACPCELPAEHSLAGIPLSRLWQQADFRISFAKNKTHEEYFYTLCLKNLLGALPLADKHLHYHSRFKVWDVCWELQQTFPTHFNLIDAYVSNHGNVGSQVLHPLPTRTLIGGEDIVLVDWVGATKMNIDPYLSPLNAKALRQAGLPPDYQVIGSLAPYAGWKNVHPLVSDSFLRLDEADTITRLLWSASFLVDRHRFPWKRRRYRWINALISPLWARVDRFRPLLWLIIGMNYFFVGIFFLTKVWRTLFSPQALPRKELPINVDRKQFTEADYEALPAFLRPLEDVIQTRPEKKSSRYTFVDGSVLFQLSGDFDHPYDAFVDKVEIGKVIHYMTDFIGGRTVPVKHDGEGRCVHQLERTVFLPQPKLGILLGGEPIDVTKIEHLAYGPDHRKLIWRTVRSDNASAIYDDGAVTFRRNGGRTRVEILVHQNFPLPLLLRWLRLEFMPVLRRLIMLRAFRGFFTRTLANYRAVADGTYQQPGHPWVEDPPVNSPAMPGT